MARTMLDNAQYARLGAWLATERPHLDDQATQPEIARHATDALGYTVTVAHVQKAEDAGLVKPKKARRTTRQAALVDRLDELEALAKAAAADIELTDLAERLDAEIDAIKTRLRVMGDSLDGALNHNASNSARLNHIEHLIGSRNETGRFSVGEIANRLDQHAASLAAIVRRLDDLAERIDPAAFPPEPTAEAPSNRRHLTKAEIDDMIAGAKTAATVEKKDAEPATPATRNGETANTEPEPADLFDGD